MPGAGVEGTGAILGFSSRRLTGVLIKASLGGGVAWFAYQLANEIQFSHGGSAYSPVATIAFLALALTVAAFVAMRQEADLAEQTQTQCARELGAEMEKAGLVGAIDEASDAV
ncbi:MAG TPA: hypothetical protein VMR62_32285, partial [Bryobacteraceae bacterium]|nr:hypothetical protein [Bryobacteraceae bacterium]